MFHKKLSLRASVSLGAMLSLIPFTGAMAQTASPAASAGPSGGLEEIVVTARKRAENLQSTPVAVSAISAESLEKNHLVRMDDLQKAVPNLVIYAVPSLVGTATFSLRGFTTPDFIPTSDSPVAIYLDGVYLARPFGALFNLTDLERVEVLRGPQGTLSGRNATAGSIALYTKGPSDKFGIQQKLSYGTFNDFTSRTTIDTGTIGETGLSFRGAYLHHTVDGYIQNTLAKHGPGYTNDNAAFFAAHGDWGNFTADYKFDYDKDKGQAGVPQVITATPTFLTYLQNYNPGLQLQPGYRSTLSYKPLPEASTRTTGHSLTLKLDAGPGLQVKAITGIRSLRTVYSTTTNAYPQLFGNASASGTAPFTIEPIDLSLIQNILVKDRQFSQELQFTGKLDRFSYSAGIYYFKEHVFESYTALGGPGSLSTVVLSTTTARYGTPSLLDFVNRARSEALYGQVSYTPPILDDRLELTGGTRYTKDRKHLVQTTPAPGTALIPIPRDIARNFSNVSSEGSIKMQWTPATMTYLRIAQAYKAGGITARDTTFSPNGYKPERELSYELGIKTDLFDRHLRINADIYRTNYKDLQISQNFSGSLGCAVASCSTLLNAGSARYDGLEAEVTVIPVRSLQIQGNIGIIDPHYNTFFINPTTDIAHSPTVRYSFLSKVTTGVAAEYSFDPMAIGELSARISWSHHSTRYFANQSLPTNFTDAARDHGTEDIGAQINLAKIPVPGLESFSISLYGTNLLDRHEVLTATDLGSYALQTYGPGRTFGAALTAKY